jgi:Flp pilus assembly protein TadG
MVKRRGPESGAAALETALVLPVFMTLVIGILNVGWALYCGAEVRHAVERATRLIIIDPDTTETAVQADVTGSLNAANPDDVNLTMTTESVGSGGQIARLTWTYGYTIDVPMINPMVLDFGSSIVVPLRP